VGKIDVFDKIATEKQIRENMVIKESFFYIKLHLKDALGMKFTAC